MIFLPLCRNPLTLTTTLTLPPGVILSGGGVETATDVRDRSDGLDADEVKGVRGRSSLAVIRRGTMMLSHRRSMQFDKTTRYRWSSEAYMKMISGLSYDACWRWHCSTELARPCDKQGSLVAAPRSNMLTADENGRRR